MGAFSESKKADGISRCGLLDRLPRENYENCPSFPLVGICKLLLLCLQGRLFCYINEKSLLSVFDRISSLAIVLSTKVRG